jgi:hypothetical protein
MGYLPRSRSLSLTSKSIIYKGASGPGTPSTPVGVEKRLRVAPRVSTACNTALTQSTHGWASTVHMRGLGAMRRFPGLPSIACACATLTQVAPKVLKSFLSHEWGTRVRIEE